jgi:phosphate transport system substrate-binding protein
MRGLLGRITAVLAILFMADAGRAQDVTLTSRDGALSIAGLLRSFDGELYRMDTQYGLLTIDAAAVICDGPACPDLTAPKSVIRFAGDAEAAGALLPSIIANFAAAKGLDLDNAPDGVTRLSIAGSVVAEISFLAMSPDAARQALSEARAEFVISRFAGPQDVARILALDALIPIM